MRQKNAVLKGVSWTFELLYNWITLPAEWPDDGIKSSPIFPKFCLKMGHSCFKLKGNIFKVTQKVTWYLSYFWIKICHLDLSKIAQSGHTVYQAYLYYFLCQYPVGHTAVVVKSSWERRLFISYSCFGTFPRIASLGQLISLSSRLSLLHSALSG